MLFRSFFNSRKIFFPKIVNYCVPLRHTIAKSNFNYYYVVLQTLYRASNDDVPMFHNLSSLKLYGLNCHDWYTWHMVRLLFCRAPKLQTFAFEMKKHRHCSYFATSCRSEQPLDIPESLSSHLTTCHYKGFSGHSMELVEQILKESKVLKTMKITFNSDLDSKEKLRIHEEIMKFPRTSQTCQIVFD